jgi:hypothetical protein
VTDASIYEVVGDNYARAGAWERMSTAGEPESFNLAEEALGRHADSSDVALRIRDFDTGDGPSATPSGSSRTPRSSGTAARSWSRTTSPAVPSSPSNADGRRIRPGGSTDGAHTVGRDSVAWKDTQTGVFTRFSPVPG